MFRAPDSFLKLLDNFLDTCTVYLSENRRCSKHKTLFTAEEKIL